MPWRKVTSTKDNKAIDLQKNTIEPDNPEQEPNNKKKHEVYIAL